MTGYNWQSKWVLPLLALSLAGCDGKIGSRNPFKKHSTDSHPSGGNDDPSSGDATDVKGTLNLPTANSLTRHLTVDEFRNKVTDLFGDYIKRDEATQSLATIKDDSGITGFSTFTATQTASEDKLTAYFVAGYALGSLLVANDDFLQAFAPCAAKAALDSGCLSQFSKNFADRAVGSDFSSSFHDDLAAQLSPLLQQGDYTKTELLAMVPAAVFSSPQFLYRLGGVTQESALKVGTMISTRDGNKLTIGTEILPYDGLTVARRLAEFVLHSVPDQKLLDAANNGDLKEAGGIEREVKRLLATKEARRAFRDYVGEWLKLKSLLDVDRDEAKVPMFNAALKEDMAEQTLRLFDYVAFDVQGDFLDVLVAPYMFISSDIANTYYPSLASSDLGDGFKKVLIPKDQLDQRIGFLTDPSLLTLTVKAEVTSPIRRGHFVSDQLLCEETDSPPAVTPLSNEIAQRAKTKFEQAAIHRQNQPCAGCHVNMDPVGMAFEHFDNMGLWRDVDEVGDKIITTGEFKGEAGMVPYLDARDLAQKLYADKKVARCFAQKIAEFALGVRLKSGTNPEMDGLISQFVTSGHRYQDFLIAVATSYSFRYANVAKEPTP